MFQKIFQQITWKKTGFNGYIYDFSVDYNSIDVNHIKDIHKYLSKKNDGGVKMFRFIKQIFASTMMFFDSLSNVDPLECISMKNQEC